MLNEISEPDQMIHHDINTLINKARMVRKHVIQMIFEAGTGHPGGSLSCVDILVVLYFVIMRHNPKDPNWILRDIFILSKGHAAPALYAILAECGYFSIQELSGLRKMGSMLQGHPDNRIPGIEVSTGSLGQGLSISCGLASAAKMNNSTTRVFTLLGDGECDEGQIWEAAMFASHYNLDNLTAIIDRNGLQVDGPTEKVMGLEPIAGKWREFGWHVIEIDGNQFDSILNGFTESEKTRGKPKVIIAHTQKGQGVSFMEWICSFHGRSLNKDEMAIALRELGEEN